MTFNYWAICIPLFRGVSAGRGVLLVLAGQASFFLVSKRSKKHRLKIYSFVLLFSAAFMRASPFSFEASGMAWAVWPEKFVRPD